MSPEQQIDALIDAGWRVIESDFSEAAFEKWRKEALRCLISLCGPDHPYTDFFKGKVLETLMMSVHTGVGVLTAARLGDFAGRPLKDV